VADTYPAFELRGLDWGAIRERHLDEVRRAGGARGRSPRLRRLSEADMLLEVAAAL
jgi:hypothetical protein